jgi:hypothetical protein
MIRNCHCSILRTGRSMRGIRRFMGGRGIERDILDKSKRSERRKKNEKIDFDYYWFLFG